MEFNYVFFDDGGGVVENMYHDVRNMENIKIRTKDAMFSSRLLNFICRVHLSQITNRKCALPFRNIWYDSLFALDFKVQRPLCFVFSSSWYFPDMFEYVRHGFPGCRLVYTFRDSVEARLRDIPRMSMAYVKDTFDLVLSYNPVDVEKYGLTHCPGNFSYIDPSEYPRYPHYDVVFIGCAKNRLESLQTAYKKLTDHGLRCYFYITEAPKNKRLYRDGIIYGSHPMPFREVVGRELGADCLLAISQAGATAVDTRYWHAVMYNKKLITNCPEAKTNSYYNPDYIDYIDDVSDLHCAFVKKTVGPVDYHYRNDNSFINTLALMESRLGS